MQRLLISSTIQFSIPKQSLFIVFAVQVLLPL